jgi:hypothetical protein
MSNISIVYSTPKVYPESPEKFVQDVTSGKMVAYRWHGYQKELRLCIRKYGSRLDRDDIISWYCGHFMRLYEKGTLEVGKIRSKIYKKWANAKQESNDGAIMPAPQVDQIERHCESHEDLLDLGEFLARDENPTTKAVICILIKCPTTKQADIAKELGISKMAVSKIFSKLGAKWTEFTLNPPQWGKL